jgi:hypothetical protein
VCDKAKAQLSIPEDIGTITIVSSAFIRMVFAFLSNNSTGKKRRLSHANEKTRQVLT